MKIDESSGLEILPSNIQDYSGTLEDLANITSVMRIDYIADFYNYLGNNLKSQAVADYLRIKPRPIIAKMEELLSDKMYESRDIILELFENETAPPKNVKYQKHLERLANELGGMRFDSLAEFYDHLGNSLTSKIQSKSNIKFVEVKEILSKKMYESRDQTLELWKKCAEHVTPKSTSYLLKDDELTSSLQK